MLSPELMQAVAHQEGRQLLASTIREVRGSEAISELGKRTQIPDNLKKGLEKDEQVTLIDFTGPEGEGVFIVSGSKWTVVKFNKVATPDRKNKADGYVTINYSNPKGKPATSTSFNVTPNENVSDTYRNEVTRLTTLINGETDSGKKEGYRAELEGFIKTYQQEMASSQRTAPATMEDLARVGALVERLLEQAQKPENIRAAVRTALRVGK